MDSLATTGFPLVALLLLQSDADLSVLAFCRGIKVSPGAYDSHG